MARRCACAHCSEHVWLVLVPHHVATNRVLQIRHVMSALVDLAAVPCAALSSRRCAAAMRAARSVARLRCAGLSVAQSLHLTLSLRTPGAPHSTQMFFWYPPLCLHCTEHQRGFCPRVAGRVHVAPQYPQSHVCVTGSGFTRCTLGLRGLGLSSRWRLTRHASLHHLRGLRALLSGIGCPHRHVLSFTCSPNECGKPHSIGYCGAFLASGISRGCL